MSSRHAPIDSLSLHRMIPGTKPPVDRPSAPSGVFEIPLEDLAFAEVAREVRAAERAHATLPNVAPFSLLPAEILDRFVQHPKLLEVKKDAEIFHQGDLGEALYVIARGEVGVVDEGPPRQALARLGPKDLFGEIALLSDRPRTATAVALADTELIPFDRAQMHALIEADRRVLSVLLSFMRDRLIGALFKKHPLFTVLSPADQERLKGRFRFLETDPGAALIREGQAVRGLLVLLSGCCEIVRSSDREPLGTLGPGEAAGERALVFGRPAEATVRALEKTLAIELAAQDFARIVTSRPEAKSWVQRVLQERNSPIQWI